MRKIATLLALILTAAGSTYAQTTNSFELSVKTGTPESIQAAVDQGGDVNGQNKSGFTPLILAVALNPDPDGIATLLKAGANVNARDTTSGMTPLMWAARLNQNPKVITTLLHAGADINARDKNGLFALTHAAITNSGPDVIAALLRPTTSFESIVKTGTPESIQAAIDQGADVNAKNEDGFTPLILAAISNPDPNVIATLLKAGANVNARDTKLGLTPLMWATRWRQNPKVISALLHAGADIDARNKEGQFVLMEAAGTNPNKEVLAALLGAEGATTANNDFKPNWQQAFAEQSFDPALAAAMRPKMRQ